MSKMPDYVKPRCLENMNSQELREILMAKKPIPFLAEGPLLQWAIHHELRTREAAHKCPPNLAMSPV